MAPGLDLSNVRTRGHSDHGASTALGSSLLASTTPGDELDILSIEGPAHFDDIKDTVPQMSEQGETPAGEELNLMTHLEPLPHKAALLVSREGQRKQKASASAATHSNTKRKKKTAAQVAYLRKLYHELNGKWDGKVRKEAMQQTGLSRIQIYKWFFDMQLQQKPKERRVSPQEQISYPPSALQPVSSEELTTGCPRPIFRIEKVVRA